MPLYLTDEQQMLRDTARDFVAEHAPVSQLRALRDADDPIGFSTDLWRSFAAMGFTGILVPEADGGLGLGHVEAGVVLEEIGRNLSPSPFLSTAVAAVEALKGCAARERWYPGIVAGETVAALALDDTPKFAGIHASLRAERSGNGFKLTGTKQFVHHAHVADLMIVSAHTSAAENDEMGITLFAVDPKSLGLEVNPQRLADSSIASRVTFANIHVDSDAVLGEVDQGARILSRLLAAGGAGASSELLGVGGGAMDMTVGYLKERKQFGVPIGSFQALQHRAAHLYSEMEVARAAVLKAQQLLDAGEDAAEAVAVAKAMTGLATTLAVQEGVQMHGGIGMTDEYDIGFYMKRARVLAELFGDANYHADFLAKAAGY